MALPLALSAVLTVLLVGRADAAVAAGPRGDAAGQLLADRYSPVVRLQQGSSRCEDGEQFPPRCSDRERARSVGVPDYAGGHDPHDCDVRRPAGDRDDARPAGPGRPGDGRAHGARGGLEPAATGPRGCAVLGRIHRPRLGLAAGPIAGIVLLLATDLAPTLINLVTSILFALAMPLTAAAVAYLYFDRAALALESPGSGELPDAGKTYSRGGDGSVEQDLPSVRSDS
jgi:hypothetical protein